MHIEKEKVLCMYFMLAKACQLNCEGCISFSDHSKILGVTRFAGQEEIIKGWSKWVDPGNINIAGGEPTLNPDLFLYMSAIRKYFPNNQVCVQSNGIRIHLIDRLYEECVKNKINVRISYHNNDPKYVENVDKSIKYLLSHCSYEIEEKPEFNGTIYHLESGIFIEVKYKQYKDSTFRTLWQGKGSDLRPSWSYENDRKFKISHTICYGKKILDPISVGYDGRLYKCIPLSALENALSVHGLTEHDEWKPYLENIDAITHDSNEKEIRNWFKRYRAPAKVCNMCNFGNDATVDHALTSAPKYKI